ncbi:MAG: DUF362 domain-containing protein [Actinobacteria bacterium]|nr:MAG: DUF362 domain-containing protein [Actinomycetota bacterium]
MSKVFFANNRAKNNMGLLDKLDKLIEQLNLSSKIEEGDLVAIKTHFGERGNTAFVPAPFLGRIVKAVKDAGGLPFLTDANTLYKGSRSNAIDHINTAVENGFSYATTRAPVIIADGLDGKDYRSVPIEAKHYKEVKIGSAAVRADAMIVVTHFKGHEMTGFGGAIKNVGMGLGSRSAKQMMHSSALPTVNLNKCTACQKCIPWCPTDAITMVKNKAVIDREKCYGCGECVVTCRFGAIDIQWKTSSDEMQERIVEHTLGALKNKDNKTIFLNFLLNITPDCDCWSWSDAPIVEDIGILASDDIVAIDKASLDLVNKAIGIKTNRLDDPDALDKFKHIFPDIDHSAQLTYGEKLGLGTKDYRLIKIG